MKTKIGIFLLSTIILASCGNVGNSLPSVAGNPFSLLVVMNDSAWRAPAGRTIVALFDQDMDGLPQSEPIMDMNQCNQTLFTDALKPSRNILLTEISEKYSAPKITYAKDKWAYPQAIVKIVAPNDTSFVSTINKYGPNIREYFVRTERERRMKYLSENGNENSKKEVADMFGIQIDMPQGLSKSTKRKNFYWITNDQAGVRQDIVIYSYPYTDKKTFSRDFIIAKRDSILKNNIPGEIKGSYMSTEVKYVMPTFNEIWVNDGYCAELRGLWRMRNGAAMGGPFYSHTRLDEINQQVITIEAFVFAPGKSKRNTIRQLEAVVFSAKLPQEINAIKEVEIVADKKK